MLSLLVAQAEIVSVLEDRYSIKKQISVAGKPILTHTHTHTHIYTPTNIHKHSAGTCVPDMLQARPPRHIPKGPSQWWTGQPWVTGTSRVGDQQLLCLSISYFG